jgi:phosphatidylserine/phosphatidylglycerophosphate/cardiolipin synthase-like enzyme
MGACSTGYGIALGLCVALGCTTAGETLEDGGGGAPPDASGEPGTQVDAGAPSSCGDFACGWGEDCESCQEDCSSCAPALSLWMTAPDSAAPDPLGEERVGAFEGALLSDIEAAHESVFVAVYGLSRKNVAAALQRARTRGVDVRLVTECETRSGAQEQLLAELEAGGVLVADDRSSFGGLGAGCPEEGGAMHHKFVLIDRRLVWAGSANLTSTDLNYNHNHAFRIDDVRVATYFRTEWDELWLGHFGTGKAPRDALELQLGSAHIRVGFSPRRATNGDSVTRGLVLAGLESARSSIAFAAFALTDWQVSAVLAARPGVARGIVDATQSGQASSTALELCHQGIDLVIENFPGKVHHKLAAIDAGEPNALVIGGSANWSAGGFDENDETVLLVEDVGLAGQAGVEVERLVDDPASAGLSCCFHSAEAYTAASSLCGDAPCVCQNGLDDDFDGAVDDEDSGCAGPFTCPPG